MKILVTGATGHLGPYVVQALQADGHHVRALVRSSSDRGWLEANDVEITDGDILDPSSLEPAVSGVAAVVHMAALHDSWAKHRQDFVRINVDGALNVLRASETAGLHRMVFVSSGSTIGEAKDAIGDETTERRDYALSDYERSKVQAEAALLEHADAVDLVIVNPGTVYGPGDASGTGQSLIGALTGRLGVSVEAPAAWVYVEDVARGVAAVLIRGRPGERYILAGQNLSRITFLRHGVDLAGLDTEIRLASPLAWQAFATLYGLGAMISRNRPPISRTAVRIALHGCMLDGSKAQRDLGITYTSLDDGLNATLDWLHDTGLADLPEDDGADAGPSAGDESA